ncbi:MAG: hypothetical protein J5772_09295 [Clostridia bacterium]|nr:hypothetical protein [Clostridia bacterium]
MELKKLEYYSPGYPGKKLAGAAARLGALAGAVIVTAGVALGCGPEPKLDGDIAIDDPEDSVIETPGADEEPEVKPSEETPPDITGIILPAPTDAGE